MGKSGGKIGKNWRENCQNCMSKGPIWARILGILGDIFWEFLEFLG